MRYKTNARFRESSILAPPSHVLQQERTVNYLFNFAHVQRCDLIFADLVKQDTDRARQNS